ncbi:hypothetical protein ACLOJK_020533 [Asimina triloba]
MPPSTSLLKMGCCFGKQQQQAPNAPPPPSPHPPEKLPVPASDPCPADDRSCVPASAVEEETVKEVLSETSKPSFLKPEEEEEKLEKKDAVLINGCDEISEISDLCSLSESVSTTTMTEKRCEEGDDGEVEMRARENRSPAKFRRKRSAPGEFSGRRERGGKSPARRSEPSPGRRTPGREVGQTNRGRSSAGSNGFRRDVGENSGRRSRSPATRAERNAAPRNDLGRSPSARKTGWSPGKMPAGLQDDGRRKAAAAAAEKDDFNVPPANESLENPLSPFARGKHVWNSLTQSGDLNRSSCIHLLGSTLASSILRIESINFGRMGFADAAAADVNT